jgi:HSP20 family molecular chaperone IbpA
MSYINSNLNNLFIDIPGINPNDLNIIYDNGYIIVSKKIINDIDVINSSAFIIKKELPIGINVKSLKLFYEFGRITVSYNFCSDPQQLILNL